MEKVEISIRVVSFLYGLAIVGLIQSLQDQDTDIIMIATVFTLVFTCPCLWALIRFCREWDARRKMVVLPDKAPKKKPNIALPKEKAAVRTQAEILAEQREKVKKIHNVTDKKLKTAKTPKRKSQSEKKK